MSYFQQLLNDKSAKFRINMRKHNKSLFAITYKL